MSGDTWRLCACDYPRPPDTPKGKRWQCPSCGTTYKLTGPKPKRWWRDWSAPEGHWVRTRR